MSPPYTCPKDKEYAMSYFPFANITEKVSWMVQYARQAMFTLKECFGRQLGRFNISDSIDLSYGLHSIHHTLKIPRYMTNPLFLLEGIFRYYWRGRKGRLFCKTNVLLIVVQHDDIISDVTAWHTRDPESRTRCTHVYLKPPNKSSIAKPAIQTIRCSGSLWETPSKFHACHRHNRLALLTRLLSIKLLHYFLALLTLAQAHWLYAKVKFQ